VEQKQLQGGRVNESTQARTAAYATTAHKTCFKKIILSPGSILQTYPLLVKSVSVRKIKLL